MNQAKQIIWNHNPAVVTYPMSKHHDSTRSIVTHDDAYTDQIAECRLQCRSSKLSQYR